MRVKLDPQLVLLGGGFSQIGRCGDGAQPKRKFRIKG
jgi:hypothetical protein